MTARPPSMRTAAPSSPCSTPTSRSPPARPPGRPARTRSSSPGGTLQAHPPPAAYWVRRRSEVVAVMDNNLRPPRVTDAVRRGGVPRLVTGAVLKTVVAGYPGQAGSIPVRLRHDDFRNRGRWVVQDSRRTTPRTDHVLADSRLVEAAGRLGRP